LNAHVAMRRGRAARPLDDVIRELLLDQPLDAVREQLGLGAHGVR
jgi:hypothetical protein